MGVAQINFHSLGPIYMVSGIRGNPSTRDNFIERLYEKHLSLLAESKLTLHDYLKPSWNIQMLGYSSVFFKFLSGHSITVGFAALKFYFFNISPKIWTLRDTRNAVSCPG